MTISLYEITVPVMVLAMRRMDLMLAKGRRPAEEHGIDQEDLAGARLWPDMMSFRHQVQRTSDTAR